MALVIISIIILGFYIKTSSSSIKDTLYVVHKALGIVSMILIIFRIFCRIFSQIPSHSKTTSYFSIIVSKYVHTLLYFFMIVMPLSGYMMSSASGKAIKIIFFDVPLIFTQNKSLAFLYNKIHTSSSYIITILIMLHVLGTFKHLIIDKENIFKRIT